MFFQSFKKIHKFVSTRILLDRYEKEFINFRYFASTLDGKKFISDKKKIILSNCFDESYNLGEDVKRQLKLV